MLSGPVKLAGFPQAADLVSLTMRLGQSLGQSVQQRHFSHAVGQYGIVLDRLDRRIDPSLALNRQQRTVRILGAASGAIGEIHVPRPLVEVIGQQWPRPWPEVMKRVIPGLLEWIPRSVIKTSAGDVAVQTVVPPVSGRPHQHIDRVDTAVDHVESITLDGRGERRQNPGLGKVIRVVLADGDTGRGGLAPRFKIGLAPVAHVVVPASVVTTPVGPDHALLGMHLDITRRLLNRRVPPNGFHHHMRGDLGKPLDHVAHDQHQRIARADLAALGTRARLAPVEWRDVQDVDSGALADERGRVLRHLSSGVRIGPAELGTGKRLWHALALAHTEPIGVFLHVVVVAQKQVERVAGAVQQHASSIQLVDQAGLPHPLVLRHERRVAFALPPHRVVAGLHGPIELFEGSLPIHLEEPGAAVADPILERAGHRAAPTSTASVDRFGTTSGSSGSCVG